MDQIENFVRSTLSSSVSDTSSTIVVSDISTFPDPSSGGEYNVVVWNNNEYSSADQDPSVEILRVTAIDSSKNQLTISRGQENTTAASHAKGSTVHLSTTKKTYTDIDSSISDKLDSADFPHDHTESDLSTVPNAGLSNSSLTIAGNSVSLGSSVSVAHADLSSIGENDHHSKDHDHSESDISTIPNSALVNDSLLIAGNVVSLGSSTSISHNDLSNIGQSDHHVRFASDPNDRLSDIPTVPHSDLSSIGRDDHHTRYADSEARSAIESGVLSKVTYANFEITENSSTNSLDFNYTG